MKKNFQFSIFNFQKGFTLIETLVAIVILSVVVTGAFSAAQSAISYSIYSKDQIIAFYLAQEAVEQVRNLRDENGLLGQHWLTGISEVSSDSCYFGNDCSVEPATNDNTVRCDVSGCPYLRQNPATGVYGYIGSWEVTPFKRTITLASVSADEISILVKVNWSKGLIEREFRIRESILNWQ